MPRSRSVESEHLDGEVSSQRPVSQESIGGMIDEVDERVASETRPAILRQSPEGDNAMVVRVEMHPEDILKTQIDPFSVNLFPTFEGYIRIGD